MEIIPRVDWHARSPRARQTVSWGSRTEFVVHHSAGPPTQTVRAIQNFHMDGNKWSDIGYNFLVDRAGRIYEGRGWLVIGAHAQGHNTSGIGVCVIGRDGADITTAAKTAVRWLYDESARKARRKLTMRCHGDVNATSCPGSTLRAWVKAGMVAPGGKPPKPPKPPAKPGAVPPWPGRLFKYPPLIQGTDVRDWQSQMRRRRWSIAVDYAYGPKSVAVCKAFQKEKGLTVDGIVGPATWRATWTAPVT